MKLRVSHKLSIDNFQSIKHFETDLKGFVSIIGKSDTGKSAIVRAVKFLLENNWQDSYMRNGTNKTTITLDDITRIRSKSKNSYIIDGKEFSKVGINIPQELVAKGYSVFNYGDDSDNTLAVGQYDPLFLVNSTEVEQTKIFQSIFGTVKYEEAVKLMVKDRRQLAIDNKDLIEQHRNKTRIVSNMKIKIDILKEINNKLDKISLLNEYVEILRQVNFVKHEIGVNVSRRDYVISLENNNDVLLSLHSYISITEQIKNAENMLSVSRNNMEMMDNYENKLAMLKDVVLYKQHLSTIAEITDFLRVSRKKQSIYKEQYNRLELLQNLNEYKSMDLAPIKEHISNLHVIRNSVLRLILLMAYKHNTILFNDTKNNISNLQKELVQIQKDMPTSCPCCGTYLESENA